MHRPQASPVRVRPPPGHGHSSSLTATNCAIDDVMCFWRNASSSSDSCAAGHKRRRIGVLLRCSFREGRIYVKFAAESTHGGRAGRRGAAEAIPRGIKGGGGGEPKRAVSPSRLRAIRTSSPCCCACAFESFPSVLSLWIRREGGEGDRERVSRNTFRCVRTCGLRWKGQALHALAQRHVYARRRSASRL